MDSISSPKYQFLCAILFLLSIQVLGNQFQVGNLNCWAVPPAGYLYVYVNYSNYNTFKVGDSLFFLYPPSQDSVLQVTAADFATCNTAHPIWSSNSGNSVYNINATGVYYFISGVPDNCRNNEKLQVCVPNNGTCATYTAPLPALTPAPAPAPSQLRSVSSAPSPTPLWAPAWSPSLSNPSRTPLLSPKSSPSYSAMSPIIRSLSSISRPIVVVSAFLGLLVLALVME